MFKHQNYVNVRSLKLAGFFKIKGKQSDKKQFFKC